MTRYYLRSKGSANFEGPYDVAQISEQLRSRRTSGKIECLEAIGQSHGTLKRSTGWRDVREIVPVAAGEDAAQTSKSAIKACRNCGGTEWYTREAEFEGDAGAALPIGVFWLRAECRLRVCGGCGTVEWFLTPASLKKVKAEYARES